MEPQAPGVAVQADAAPQETPQQQSTENAQPQQPVAPQPPPDIPEEFRGVAQVQDGKVIVPLAAVVDERRKRQEFEQRFRQQEQELFLARQFQHAQQPQEPKQEEFKLPDAIANLRDDEVVNGAEVKSALRDMMTIVTQRLNAAPQQNEREKEMIGETMIQSMDPNAVPRLQAGIQQISANPMLQQQMRMVNPMLRPFIAYRMGYGENFNQAAQAAVAQTGQPLTGQPAPQMPGPYGFQQPPQPAPAYQQVANQPMNYQQVAANQGIPPATSSIGGTSSVNQARYWATAPKDEFERRLQQIKNGQG